MVLYPWGGEFILGNPDSPVAVITLGESFKLDKEKVAIYGNMKTENLGIEKVVANVISNPNLRFLLVVGREIRGHRSGGTIVALYKNGIDDNNRVIGAPGAVPYIENVDQEAITRWQDQVELLDMIGCVDLDTIEKAMEDCISRNPGSYGEPYIAIRLEEKSSRKMGPGLSGKIALYADLTIDYTGYVEPLESQEEG